MVDRASSFRTVKTVKIADPATTAYRSMPPHFGRRENMTHRSADACWMDRPHPMGVNFEGCSRNDRDRQHAIFRKHRAIYQSAMRLPRRDVIDENSPRLSANVSRPRLAPGLTPSPSRRITVDSNIATVTVTITATVGAFGVALLNGATHVPDPPSDLTGSSPVLHSPRQLTPPTRNLHAYPRPEDLVTEPGDRNRQACAVRQLCRARPPQADVSAPALVGR